MSKITRTILSIILTLIGVGIIIIAVSLWPNPFNLVMVLIGMLPLSGVGLGFMFVGYEVYKGATIREAFEYLNLF